MARSPNFTTISFTVRKDVVEKFRKMRTHYGDTSRTLRTLLEAYVDGRVVIAQKKVPKIVSA